MNQKLTIVGATLLMLALTTSTGSLSAQNVTTNASNAVGNMTASANQTASELGQNAQSELNKTGEALEEFGKNATEVGGDILNKTGEAAQKIGAGAAGVFANLTGEVKEGISDNSSNSSKQTQKIKTLLLIVAHKTATSNESLSS